MRISSVKQSYQSNNKNKNNPNFGMYFSLKPVKTQFLEDFTKSVIMRKQILAGSTFGGDEDSYIMYDVKNRIDLLRVLTKLNRDNNILYRDIPISIESVEREKYKLILGIKLPSIGEMRKYQSLGGIGDRTWSYQIAPDRYSAATTLKDLQTNEELDFAEQYLLEDNLNLPEIEQLFG